MNTAGEPDEGKPHVRFDEGRPARRLRRTSRLLYQRLIPVALESQSLRDGAS